jgi:hypothetical protein
MHHPDAARHLDGLFRAAGELPPWSARHEAMCHQIRGILGYCEASGMRSSAADWTRRLSRTEGWVE